MIRHGKFRVLFVSDSLGTPIHPRGIFNYSVSLIEILKRVGAEVVLVVEKAPDYGVDEKLWGRSNREWSAAVNSSQLAEIYRYFTESRFSFNWRYQTRHFRFLAENLPTIARLLQWLKEKTGGNRGALVENRGGAVDFIPERGEHLAMMDGFLLKRRIYSSSMSRAVNNMDPVDLDASGYDLVVVDTPHFVNIAGIDPSRIFSVIHDLIPLRDPTMSANWRYLFFKKMKATLALDGNLIFVSNYTRDVFHLNFPECKARREIVLYPTIRSSLMQAARQAKSPERSNYVPKMPVASAEKLLRNGAERGSARKSKRERRHSVSLSYKKEGWDPALPYFASAVSDEPRKNIGTLVQAFKRLLGRANIVIVGEVDAARHLAADGGEIPNIHFAGYVQESEKIEILRGASGVIVPSFAEGFGIPLVEGAMLGTPIVCSDIAVFREVVGDLASYFDPYAAQSLSAAIETVLSDPGACAEKAAQLRQAVIARFSQQAMERRLTDELAAVGLPIRPAAGFLFELGE